MTRLVQAVRNHSSISKKRAFNPPKPVVPPDATPKEAATPLVRSTPTTTPPGKNFKNESFAYAIMVYKVIHPKVAALDENETPSKCVGALCRSMWRAFRKSVGPPATTKLDDPGSSADRMLSSYH